MLLYPTQLPATALTSVTRLKASLAPGVAAPTLSGWVARLRERLARRIAASSAS